MLPLLQEHLLQSYFSIFYFAINLGSLLSMIVTPMLRGKWFNVNLYYFSNTHSCYFKENEYTLFEDQLIFTVGHCWGYELSTSLREQVERREVGNYSNKNHIRSLYSANKEKCLLVLACWHCSLLHCRFLIMSSLFVCLLLLLLFFMGDARLFNDVEDMFFFSGDVSCFGQDCYMLAFGVPALLMILSIGTVYNIFPAFTTLSKILNPLTPKWLASNFSIQYDSWITHYGQRNKGNDH